MTKLKTSVWNKLQKHKNANYSRDIISLFKADDNRFEKFSMSFSNILLDFSKNRITPETLKLLLQLANEKKVCEKRDAMFLGEPINTSENRAVLHTALRNIKNTNIVM